MPITWQNVNGPSLEGVGNILKGAQSSFDSSFDTLGRVLKQREDAGIAQWDKGKVDNTNAILDMVSKTQTPEELQALAQSGAIDKMVASYGDQVDKASLRDVVNTQLNALRQRSTATNAYNASETARLEAPIAEAYRVAVLNKDEKTQAAIREANPGLKNWSALLTEEQKTEQGFADRDRTVAEQQRADELAPGQQANKRQQIANDSMSLRDQAVVLADTQKANVLLESAAKARTTKDTGRVTAANNIATTLGIKVPKDASGLPDITQMSEAQVTRYGAAFKKAGLDTSASSSAQLAELHKSLVAAGLKTSVIQAKMAEASAVFNEASLSAEDTAKLNAKNLRITQQVEIDKANNPAYTPPKEALAMQTATLSSLDAKIKDYGGTKDRIRTDVSTMMNDGILINGKLIKVPPRVIDYALAAGVESDAWFFTKNDTVDNITKIAREYMTTPEYAEAAKRAGYLDSGGDQVELFNNTIEARRAAGINSNDDYSATLDNRVSIIDGKAVKLTATKAEADRVTKKLAQHQFKQARRMSEEDLATINAMGAIY